MNAPFIASIGQYHPFQKGLLMPFNLESGVTFQHTWTNIYGKFILIEKCYKKMIYYRYT